MTTIDGAHSDAAWPTAPPGAGGLKIGFPEARQYLAPHHRVSHPTMIALLSLGLGVIAGVLVVVALLATPGPAPACPPLKCQGPPIRHPGAAGPTQAAAGPPVETGTLYQSPSGFSLRFMPQPQVVTNSSGIGLTYGFVNGGTAYFDVTGGPTNGETPESVVVATANSNFPNAQPVYQLPDPLIGYEPAYGVAFNVAPANSYGSTKPDRIILDASVVNGFGILVLTYGSLLPPVTPSSQFFNGHPSPADLNMAYLGGDEIINSIRFP